MNCPFCDAPILESSDICPSCSKRLARSDGDFWTNDPDAITYVQTVANRLSSRGFKVTNFTTAAPLQELALVAFDNFEHGIVSPNLRHIIFASNLSQPKRQGIDQFTKQCTVFAMRNFRRQGLVSVPVAVGRSFSKDLKEWVANTPRERLYGVIEFPVLVCLEEKLLVYLRKTPIWGWLFYKKSRKFIDEELRF